MKHNILRVKKMFVLKRVFKEGIYHKISIGYMMLNQPSSQDDHSCLLGKNCRAVQPAYIWNKNHTHGKQTKTTVIILLCNSVVFTFYNVQNQAGVFKWVKANHVT